MCEASWLRFLFCCQRVFDFRDPFLRRLEIVALFEILDQLFVLGERVRGLVQLHVRLGEVVQRRVAIRVARIAVEQRLEAIDGARIPPRAEVEEAANSGLDWNADEIWPRSWLLLGSSHGAGLVVDCDIPLGEPSAILHPDVTAISDPEAPYPQTIEPSLTALVRTWVRLFELGVYGWDTAEQVPIHRYELLPDNLRMKEIY